MADHGATRPLRRIATRRIRRALACAVALSTSLVGCAPSTTTRDGELDEQEWRDAPVWLTQGCPAYWSTPSEREGVVCGVGSAAAGRDRVAARDTAIARARDAVARSVEVRVESFVRVETSSGATDEESVEAVVHQLTSTLLPACRVVEVWRAPSGSVHALVALDATLLPDG